jgi:hypothetical protein
MIVRSAYLEGYVREDDKVRFDHSMGVIVAAAIRTYPGILDLKIRYVQTPEPGAPAIYMIFDLYFDSVEAMNAALQSETRAKVRAAISEGMTMFVGRVYHLVSEEA